jgi:hypothetical protein
MRIEQPSLAARVLYEGGWLRILGVVCSLVGLVAVQLPMYPSPEASVDNHLWRLMALWLPALGTLGLGATLIGGGRWILLGLAAPVLGWVLLWHPVSDRIADRDVPAFETQLTLTERAARGASFRKMDGHWYQVKPWIARHFF